MKKLFEPCKIGRLVIKNRSVMPPMQVLVGELNGEPGERIIRYYEERAKGGVGLIIIEATAIDDINNKPWDHQLCLTADKYRSAFQRLTEAVHKYDCHIFIQLHHYGSKSAPTAEGPGWTSSEVPAMPGGKPGHMMTKEEIKIVEKRFIDAAVRAQRVGFDGVELAGTHGYLLTQFISPYYNNRTDEYGGSSENRCRIYTELIEGIHAACGRAFPVSVRFPGDEFSHDVPGTLTLEDGVEIAKILEKAGADVLNVSNGNNFNANANCEPYSYKEGWKKYVAKAVHDAVSIPVMATNTIKDPEFADALLEEGVSDFVCLGRALIADPMFMNKAKKGDVVGIRKCIGCMYCREQLYAQMPIQCSLNPRAVCEYEYPMEYPQDGHGRKIAVIGGGPAGMEAAIVMRSRGFDVTLFEKENELGGTLHLADKGPGKEKITRFIETMTTECERLGVDIRLGKAADMEMVKAIDPEGVIVAFGASPIIPRVPGVDKSCVVTSHDVISNRVALTGTVAVIGAGMTGLECAEKLLNDGCKVKIVEMQAQVGPGMFSVITADLMSRLKPMGPEIYTGHALKEICDDGLMVTEMATGELKKLDADTIVLSMGVSPNVALADSYKAAFEHVLVIGDAQKGGRIPTAMKDAYTKSLVFCKE